MKAAGQCAPTPATFDPPIESTTKLHISTLESIIVQQDDETIAEVTPIIKK